MNGARISGRLDRVIDIGACTLFAGAVGFAVWTALPATGLAYRISSAIAAALAGHLIAKTFLGCFRISEDLTLPTFQAVEFKGGPDFVACDVDSGARGDFDPLDEVAADELLLDDIVGKLLPEARVIRLFDPAKMPTAGELQDRIDRHLGKPRAADPDSTRELYDALATLRRSLR